MVQIVNPLENAVVLLQDFGFFTVILPFVLIYALTFGLLNVVGIFGNDDSAKTVNQVIALSVGAFVITSTDAVNNLALIIPQAGFLLVISLLLLMVLGIFGFKSKFEDILGKSAESTLSRKLVALTIVIVFLLVIDLGLPEGIPIIRPLSLFLVGQSSTLSGEGFETILSLALILGFPLAVMYMIGRSSPGEKTKDKENI